MLHFVQYDEWGGLQDKLTNKILKNEIKPAQKAGRDQTHDDDGYGIADGLLASWPNDLLKLGAYLLEKLCYALKK